MNNKLTVFLGGTCGNSTWRSELQEKLSGKVDAFNPVVPDWTPECQAIEDAHKQNDDIVLFVITPETPGLYSASEVTASALLFPERTVFCVLPEANGKAFEKHEQKAWNKIFKDVAAFGAKTCADLEDVANTLNEMALNKQDS